MLEAASVLPLSAHLLPTLMIVAMMVAVEQDPLTGSSRWNPGGGQWVEGKLCASLERGQGLGIAQ